MPFEDLKQTSFAEYHKDSISSTMSTEMNSQRNNSRDYRYSWGFLRNASGKEPTCQCRRYKRLGFNPQLRKISWRRAWQPSQVLLPEESHGQRSLAGYSPWGSQRVCQIWLKWLSTHRYYNEYEEILISIHAHTCLLPKLLLKNSALLHFSGKIKAYKNNLSQKYSY